MLILIVKNNIINIRKNKSNRHFLLTKLCGLLKKLRRGSLIKIMHFIFLAIIINVGECEDYSHNSVYEIQIFHLIASGN